MYETASRPVGRRPVRDHAPDRATTAASMPGPHVDLPRHHRRRQPPDILVRAREKRPYENADAKGQLPEDDQLVTRSPHWKPTHPPEPGSSGRHRELRPATGEQGNRHHL